MSEQALTDEQKRDFYFLGARWLVVAYLTVILLSIYFGVSRHFSFVPFLIIIIILFLYNLACPWIILHTPKFTSRRVLWIRAYQNPLLITLLVHYTGGIESPLVLLYLVEALTMTVYGYIWESYVISASLFVFSILIFLAEAYGLLPHYFLGLLPGTLYKNIGYIFVYGLAIAGTSGLFTYITTFFHRNLIEKSRQIELLSNARLDFISSLIHEIKSPLTSIIGYAELIQDLSLGPINEQQKNPISVITKQSKRILKLTNDMLLLTRLEMGKIKLDKTKVDLVELLNQVMLEQKPNLDSKNIKLVQEFNLDIPLIDMDEAKIWEVITNLFTNAIKFSNDNGRIYVSVSVSKKEVTVSVKDEGIGITAVDLAHIFEKFYRSNKESFDRKGTGLGLAISRSIIEYHGGNLAVVSDGPGQGSTFSFSLPLSL